MMPFAEATWRTLPAVVGAVAALFPDPVVHLGGDEVQGACWTEDAAVRREMDRRQLRSVHDVEAHFERRLERDVIGALRAGGKRVARWQDIWFHEASERTTSVVQFWQAYSADVARRMNEQLARGAGAVRMVASGGWYLDADCLSWERAYAADPAHAYGVQPAVRAHVDGVEACVWETQHEQYDTENVWLRLVALAERAWSGRRGAPHGWRRRLAQACARAARLRVFPAAMCDLDAWRPPRTNIKQTEPHRAWIKVYTGEVCENHRLRAAQRS